MSTFVKKNKVLQEWNISFRVIKHEKSKFIKGAAIVVGPYEVQLLKYHSGECTPCLSIFGTTLEEAWRSMLDAMDRNEEYLKNTLNLSDEPYED